MKNLIHNSKFIIQPLKFQNGFSLIEILVVIGLVGFVAAFGLALGFGSFQQDVLMAERELFVTTLQEARSAAMVNRYQSDHGVHVESDGVTLFTGDNFGASATTTVVNWNDVVTINPATDIVFESLSGSVASNITYTLSANGRTTTVTVSTNGRINW